MDIEQIFNTYFKKVYLFYYHKTMHQQIAEDLTSKAFLVFAQKARDIEIDDPKSFLFGIARRVWSGYLRDKYRSKEITIDLENVQLKDEPATDVKVSFQDSDIAQIVEMLPKSQKKIIELRYVNNLSVSETAEFLGHNIDYVKTTQSRALRSLRKYIQEASI
jgi:RNA polymerase sigma-70 factor, ECF subfamily